MSRRKRYPVAPSLKDIETAVGTGEAERVAEHGVEYLRVRRDSRMAPRGVAAVDGRVVPDYPHIARVFALSAGIAENFEGPFYAEEKIDGYNVRLVRTQGRFLPLTRSGQLCPFTLDRLPDLVDPEALHRFFDAHPDMVICAEVAGPGNPYMDTISPHGGEDVALLVFDLMRYDDQRFVGVEEREAILDAFPEIPQAPKLGRFTDADLEALGAAILRIDADGGEGVVLKPPGDGLRLKYVCPSINLQDIASEAALEMETPGEFYTHRVVRMVMALHELGRQDRIPELGAAMGHALVDGFDRALSQVEQSGHLAKRYHIRLRDERTADELLERLNAGSKTIRAREVSRRKLGEHTELVFEKIFRKSTSKLETLLKGGPIFD
ncbi:RNA ligase [Ectothiorhodospiraceae bacterium WFHF3C12]|nr:RNA ligase [Ectothiorhodospiraceae bacterium WFHF3C12]